MASNQKMSQGKKVLELSKDAMFKISCKSDNIFKKHCDGRRDGRTDGRTDKVTYRGASLLIMIIHGLELEKDKSTPGK